MKDAFQSSNFSHWLAPFAIDNYLRTVACTDYLSSTEPWWAADLGEPMDVVQVSITNDHSEHG